MAEIGGEASREGAPGPETSLDLRIEEAKARVHQESRFFRSLSVALVVCVLLAVLNRFTNPQYYWSGWVALIWGALLVVRITPVRVRRMDQKLAPGAPAAAVAQIARKPAARTPPAWSDGHHGAHAVALHITALALLDDGAARHHQVVVRQPGGKVIELFHQQDRHIPPARQLADHFANLFDDGGLDPLGGFIEDQQLWTAGQRAANRQLLLLTAG